MDPFSTAGTLTVSMLEEAMKIAVSNFGTPDSLMIGDDAFSQLKGMFDPDWMAKRQFHDSMEKLLWPNRFPRIHQWSDLVKASGAV